MSKRFNIASKCACTEKGPKEKSGEENDGDKARKSRKSPGEQQLAARSKI